jgi:hypothetical protein
MVTLKIAFVVILMSWLRSWLFLSEMCRNSDCKMICGLGLRIEVCRGYVIY